MISQQINNEQIKFSSESEYFLEIIDIGFKIL